MSEHILEPIRVRYAVWPGERHSAVEALISLLDDARRLGQEIPVIPFGERDQGTCVFCRHDSRYQEPDEAHRPDCPWLAMPKIVAALEAAEALKLTANAYLANLGTSDPPTPDDLAAALKDAETT